jgi:nucleotidyltransferase substrate binding protein (TIGR01987 family)
MIRGIKIDNLIKAQSQFEEYRSNISKPQKRAGAIQAFEYTYELAWKMIKDYYEEQGEVNIQGSRDALRLAFQRGIIKDGDNWMKMIKSRIATVHTYNEEVAKQIIQDIRNLYFQLFIELQTKMQNI